MKLLLLLLPVLSLASAAAVFQPSTQPFLVSKAVAKRYAPVMRFAPYERSFPTSMEFMLAHATLKSTKDKGFAVRRPSPMDLYTHADRSYYLEVDNDPVTHAGNAPRNGVVRAPIYVSAQEWKDTIAITYSVLYTFQPSQVLKVSTPIKSGEFVINNFGEHQGDVEGVAVHLTKDFSRIVKVVFYHHGDEATFDAKDVAYEDGTHPVVKVAQNGHASYNARKETGSRVVTYDYGISWLGTHLYALDALDDRNTGAVWRPFEHDEDVVFVGMDDKGLVMGDRPWVAFAGDLGATYDTGVHSVTKVDGSAMDKAEGWLIETATKLFQSKIPSQFKHASGPDGFGNRNFIRGTKRQ